MSDTPPSWLTDLATGLTARGSVSPMPLPMPAPEDGSGRPSAVLIALAELASGPGVLLIERAADMRTHAGQVAFPGGATDADDDSPVGTALREATEEVGLEPSSVEVLATLPQLFLPPSGFLVTPVLAWWARPHEVGPVDRREVARVAVVPLAELADPANRFTTTHPAGRVGPGFEVEGLFIWGFTGAILAHLLSVGGWSRPWNEARVRPAPIGTGRPPIDPLGTVSA